jgi:diaminohydroxyphosphoribosylaminopyrimidine deaminase/5-amino-6-(5-phosphoribosylamino)uracil reductase
MVQIDPIKYMQLALKIAAQGGGYVSPNPMVGAVIVRNDVIIGQGYHQLFGQPHAEINAISDCIVRGHAAAGATMYITLEPCCHYGQTPPCVEALINAKIGKVVIATIDSSAKVSGKGVKALRDMGISVSVGLCQQQATDLNRGFFNVHKIGLPQVIIKWAQSRDHKLAWPLGKKQWITNEKSRLHVHQMRSQFGAVMCGIGTVLADDPLLTVRLDRDSAQPVRMVLDSKLRMSFDAKIVQSARESSLYIFVAEETLTIEKNKIMALSDLGCIIEAVPSSLGQLSISAILKRVVSLHINDVYVEGGLAMYQSFYTQNLVDRLMIYKSNFDIGEQSQYPLPYDLTIDRVVKSSKVIHECYFDRDSYLELLLPARTE